MDDDINTLKFDWKFGVEELVLKVMSYEDGRGLYIGLFDKDEDGEWELFDDLTVNLPDHPLEPDEAFISDFSCRSKLAFIEKYKLGKVLSETGKSGMSEYKLVAFDLERLAEFDREGVLEYRSLIGLNAERISVDKKSVTR